jgi:hypothetical protein
MSALDDRLDAIDEHRQMVRIHEAAHAVVADCLGLALPGRIVAAGDRAENARDLEADARADPASLVAVLLAGGAAEAVFGATLPWPGAGRDLRFALDVVSANGLGRDVAIRTGITVAGRVASRERRLIGALADILAEEGILETRGLVRDALDEARSRVGRRNFDVVRDEAAATAALAAFDEQGKRDTEQVRRDLETVARIQARSAPRGRDRRASPKAARLRPDDSILDMEAFGHAAEYLIGGADKQRRARRAVA